MIAAELSFPAGGRFHATPWGRHVNEGPVEWPVEPWRLLRALVATWFHKAHADIARETLIRLVTALAASPPSFRLPAASLGHTRHWMPVISGKNSAKTKVFDAFVHVADGESLGVRWDVDLLPADRTALGLLLERLGYLGRAESIVEARLLGEDSAPARHYETRPLPAGDSAGPDEELVQVLAPLSENDYRVWREGYLQARAAMPVRGKQRAADLPPPVPATIFDALLVDTGALQAAGWSLPPGARRLAYVRPVDAFQTRPAPHRRSDGKLPTVARYAIASAVLPSITAAVSIGDRVHRVLVKCSPQPVFTGCDAAKVPLRHQHRHASVLSECDLSDDRVRALTIYAPDGFDAAARGALSNLPPVWGHGGHDLQLVLFGFGEPTDFAGPDAGAGQSRILGESKEWVSLTPFIPTRHGKTGAKGAWKVDEHGDQIGGPKHDLRRLLRLLHPENEFEIVREEAHAPTRRPLRWLQFQRRRNGGEGARAGEFGFGFRVRFSAPVRGPLALGYGAHFGLGLFVPAVSP